MLQSENMLDAAIKLQKIANFFFALPFEWNSSSNKFKVLSRRKSLTFFWLGFLISFSHVFIASILGFLARKTDTNPVSRGFTILFVFGEWASVYIQWTHAKHKKMKVYLLNNMVLYDSTHNKEKWSASDLKSVGAKNLMQQFTSSAIIMPTAMTILYTVKPCLTIGISSVILEECKFEGGGLSGISSWIFKVVYVLYTAKSYSFIVPGAFYFFQNEMFLKTYCFLRYLQLLKRKIADKSASNHDIKRISNDYRIIQTMALVFNGIYQKWAIVVLLIFQTIIQIAGVCSLIRFGKVMQVAESAVFLVCAFNAVSIILIVYGSAAHVNMCSAGVIKSFKRVTTKMGREKKWWIRFVRSCPEVKIRFGATNYIDQLSPINYMDFNINQTVTVLIAM
ncbi:unnamed protein product [Orchesella dallaii]|uniref:Gustatory receptor n=1 Tax=Orchesella dallaii TaxID=48710 RepID=A0ABP1RGF3_9HEXA